MQKPRRANTKGIGVKFGGNAAILAAIADDRAPHVKPRPFGPDWQLKAQLTFIF